MEKSPKKPKPKPFHTKKSKVEPVELPDKGTQYGPEKERVETEEDIAVDTRPRAERRRSRKEKTANERKMRSQFKKYQQQMAKPLRFRDMQLIVNQVVSALGERFTSIQDELDKLSYWPEYVSSCLSEEGNIFAVKPSVTGFEEWFEEFKAKLEAEDAEKAPAPPETEETQKEDPSG